jgi:DNA-binding transcriptional ArsR family regulator
MNVTVFEALADPTRRRLLELLAEGERTAGELAGEFATARPTVSRHLRVLRAAGLVTWQAEAQRRVYRLDPRPLAEAGAWVDRVQGRWSARLDALERLLDETPHPQPPPTTGGDER